VAESGGTGTGIGTVGGRYALVERIGSGAMGVVWRARDELLDREVAVKQLRWPDLTAAEVEVARARAMREARNAARLQHPDAISVFDVVVEDDRPWLVMEYLPSRSLAGLLAERGRVSPDEAARIGGRVAAALAAAHAAGIVHRDVKPSNVLIGHDGSVKLTDFGISRAAGDGTLTDSGMITGTPAYLAPEVARGEQPSQASDVFSLGATLYAAIEGQSPYGTSDNSFGLLYRAAAGKVEPPTRSGELTALLTRMLDTGPQVRPTAAEAVDLLAEPTAAEPADPPAEPTAARARRRWLVPAIVAGVLLVAAGAAAVHLQPWKTTYQVAPQQPAYTQQDAAELVRGHYEALPENPDVAYRNLATVFRPTFADYQQTWGQYDEVRAEGIQAVAVSPSRFLVDVQVTFIQAGAETTERYQLVLEHTEGRLLIVRSGRLDP
jgi:tRNA A-37 threonylcarbamoyl transferase component Bud32